MKKLTYCILFLLLSACDVAIDGESSEDFRKNTFIVPDGCRGVLNLVVVDGLPPGYKMDGDRNLFYFTTSGLLYTGEIKHYMQTRKQTTARFADGTEIQPVVFDWDNPDFDGERFGIIGQTGKGWSADPNGAIYEYSDNTIWAIVGQSSEFVSAYRQMHSGRPRIDSQFVCAQPEVVL